MVSPRLPILRDGFDAHHPPSAELVGDCVHCGFCLPTCPTYVLWGEEMDSPRGRIHLVKLVLEGEADLDDTVRDHLDRCLGCLGCMTACPSGVQYDQILEAARAQLERRRPREAGDQALRAFVLGLFPHRGRLRIAAALGWLAQVTGLQALFHRLGGPRLLPPRLRALVELAPKVELGPALLGSPRARPRGEPRAKVAMLEGCVQAVFFPRVNAATRAVLAAEDVEVVEVPHQGCCGALELHAGEADRARERVRALVERFERVDVDQIVVNAAGCGSTLKTAERLFDAQDPFRERAAAFSARVVDACELLDRLEPRARLRPLEARVAYHDACHLAHAQGIRSAPRALLARIPGVEILEIPDGDLCCGSAGIYNLVQPEPAEALGRRKAEAVTSTHPDLLCAANPGCLLQIRRHLGEHVRTAHPLELLAEALER